MREKLNANPVAQVALLGLLVLVVGFLLLTRMGGSEEETPAPAPAAPTEATPDATGTAPVTPDPTATAPATPEVPVTPDGSVAPAPGGASAFEAGPGLPEDVVNAWDTNKVVVLLIVNNGSVDDDKIEAIASDLGKRPDTSLFTVEAKDIADYSRIAQGVDLQQTPALVVLRPKNLTPNGAQPTATIEYGFRGPDSVNQTVEDALYKGRSDLPYYPE